MSSNNFDFNFERIGLFIKSEADKKIYDYLQEYFKNNKEIPVEEKLTEIINVVSSFYLMTNIELMKMYNQKLLEYISASKGQGDCYPSFREMAQ